MVGDYRVQRVLRSEATGVVYVASHLVLPRMAAVKVMHRTEEYLRAMAVQILREACLLEALASPGAPRIFECGMLGDKRPWIAFELIEGPSLAEVLDSDGPLHASDLVHLLRDVGETLDQLHAMGAVHARLIEDAIVCNPKRAVLRDWSHATTVASECATHAPADDIHALGIVAFHAAMGIGARTRTDDQVAHVPAELLALIDDMLGDLARRPTAAEVVACVAAFEVPTLRERRWTPVYGSAPIQVVEATLPSTRAKPSS